MIAVYASSTGPDTELEIGQRGFLAGVVSRLDEAPRALRCRALRCEVVHASDDMSPQLLQVFENAASTQQIRAFQDWEQRNAARMLSRYADLPVAGAFGSRLSDFVKVSDSCGFDFSSADPRLLDASGRYIGTLANTPKALLREFVAALDGERSLGDICSKPPFAEHSRPLLGLVDALLGVAFLVPRSIGDLEAELPAVELLRFPSQSPYAMPREYWENSIAVRNTLGALYERLDDFEAFSRGLRGLHRLATLGASATNYYGGAGGAPTVPGEFREMPIGNRFSERRKWICTHWIQLLDVSCVLMEQGSIVSTNGVPFARVGARGQECYHPSGRALIDQLNEVRVQLAAACTALEVGDTVQLLRRGALFHHAFAHAHPFANINNSIAMNILNDLFGRAGIGVVPHLYFDRVAYFLAPADYVDFFERAVEMHVMKVPGYEDRPATRALLEAVVSEQASRRQLRSRPDGLRGR